MRRPTPEGRPSSWQIIEPYVSTEEKSHLSVRDFFGPYLGVSNTPYLGTDVTFMYVSLPPRGLSVVSADFQLVRLEALLEASKLTISFLKGLLVALRIFKLNCKQRLIKE